MLAGWSWPLWPSLVLGSAHVRNPPIYVKKDLVSHVSVPHCWSTPFKLQIWSFHVCLKFFANFWAWSANIHNLVAPSPVSLIPSTPNIPYTLTSLIKFMQFPKYPFSYLCNFFSALFFLEYPSLCLPLLLLQVSLHISFFLSFPPGHFSNTVFTPITDANSVCCNT